MEWQFRRQLTRCKLPPFYTRISPSFSALSRSCTSFPLCHSAHSCSFVPHPTYEYIYSQSGCHNIRAEAQLSFHLVLPPLSAIPFVLLVALTGEMGLTKEFFIVLPHICTFVAVDVHHNYQNSDKPLAVDKENVA